MLCELEVSALATCSDAAPIALQFSCGRVLGLAVLESARIPCDAQLDVTQTRLP